MAESAGSPTDTSSLTGPTSLGSAIDPQGLSTVLEIPQHDTNPQDHGSPESPPRSKVHPSAVSHSASLVSSTGLDHDEKQLEVTPKRLRHTEPTQADLQPWQRSNDLSDTYQNGNGYHRSVDTKPSSPRKEKRGGLRNTIRRMFGRRSTKDRISVPNKAVYSAHVSPR